MNYKFSKRSREVLDTIKQELRVVMVQAIKTAPYDFGVIEGKRTLARQQELYQRGRAKPGTIVTTKDGERLRSKHQDGEAVDICIYDDGNYVWGHDGNKELAEHILKVAKELGVKLTWGGTWGRLRDEPHYELK